MEKIKKISLARSVLALVVASAAAGESEESLRKTFIEKFTAAHKETYGEDAKKNLATSYFQMLKYEREGKEGGAYRHHKGKRGKTVEAVTPIEVVVPEGSKWKVVGETTEYFASRDAARAYKKEHGGQLEKVA